MLLFSSFTLYIVFYICRPNKDIVLTDDGSA